MARNTHLHAEGLQGSDGHAKFTACAHTDPPKCSRCGKPAYISIKYRAGAGGIKEALWHDFGIDIQETLLQNERAVLCLEDWAKFQRQVTHIYEKRGSRGAAKAA